MKNTAFLCAFVLFGPVASADDPMTELTGEFCLKCHGSVDPKGDLRLDRLSADFFRDVDQLETIIDVLTEKEMPPRKSKQPTDELRSDAVALLKSKLREHAEPGRLKRLTHEEYTNTINDLFGTRFDLSGLLPADPPAEGFNKWGETQRMSPHQVESYLKTARLIADRLILDERPLQRAWEFDIEQFRGTGRGDFQTDTAHVLTTHYPWRSVLYFIEGGEREKIFRIPEFGRYWIQADVTVHHSKKAETISVSTGDPRYPTNFKKIARVVLPPDGESIFLDLTLSAGTHIAFTYESAATWNVGKNHSEYKGRQVRFTRVRITGPVTATWPTVADQRIFDGNRFRSLTAGDTRAFTEHVIGLLLSRPLPESDVAAFDQLTAQRLRATDSPTAAARTLLTALLSSPHFIYKHETDTLSDIALAHRLSYFLWNSVPDAALLTVARAGKLRSHDTLAEQVERMLADPRSDRFCEDFTRQWLQTDKIDDIGPDDRVHDKKKVTFMKIRELAREPRAFFREILQHNLSMVNFIDSDFAMVNDETAEYYNFDGVKGRAFQRATIPEDSERGGLIGQAGLLKLTSGKHSTSPILRGTWILKNIYGQKLSPPPDFVFDEPDIRAADTVKEMIELHKAIETCNRCHARIDPLGLALEHYDEMGLWRDEYRHVETRSVENKGTSIERHTSPIDSTARLPDGRQISSMNDLKAVLLEDRELVVKGILSKLASYAIGREIGVQDEAMIDEIYNRIAEEDHSLRAAIHAIVTHESFGRK